MGPLTDAIKSGINEKRVKSSSKTSKAKTTPAIGVLKIAEIAPEEPHANNKVTVL